MFAILFTWIIVTYTFAIWGKLATLLLSPAQSKQYSFLDNIIIGLCACGSIICITSLFLPSGIIISVALTATAIVSHIALHLQKIYVFEKIRSMHKSLSVTQIGICSALFFSMLLMVVMPPQLPDTLYYHIQNIMWNDEYSVVPGLANLHERFGFNSNMLLIFSTFGYKAVFGEYIYGINALLFTLIFADVMINSSKDKLLTVILSLIILFIFFYIYKLHLAAASTDFIVNIFIVYLAIQVLRNANAISSKMLLFWIVPIFCITLKLSLAFICLTGLYIVVYLIRNKSYKTLGTYILLALVIVVPWLARNVVISGYLLHPFPGIDLFDVDWKLPAEYAIRSKNFIEAYAISLEAFDATDRVLQYPLSHKISLWASEQTAPKLALVVCSLLSVIVSIPLLIRNCLRKRRVELTVFLATIIITYLFWIIMAPDIRFALGIVCVAILMPLYLLANKSQWLKKHVGPKVMTGIAILFVGIISLLSVRYLTSIKDPEKPYSDILYKPQGMERLRNEGIIIIYDPVTINNLRLYIPHSGCLDCELPCSRDYIDNIEMRGTSLQEGFREKKE